MENQAEVIEGLLKKHLGAVQENMSKDNQDAIKREVESQLESFKSSTQGQLDAMSKNATPYEREDAKTSNNILKSKSQDFLDNYRPNANSKFEIREKGVTIGSLTNAGDTRVIQQSRRPGFVFEPDRVEHVRDFMTVEGTDSDLHQHVREESFTDNTGLVTPNGSNSFSKSDFTLKSYTTQMYDLQAGLDVHKNILRDLPQVQSFISQRLTTKFYLKEDYFLVYGDGTTGVISGLNTTAVALNVGTRRDANAQIVDALMIAKLQNRKREYATNVICLNPEETTTIDLLKDTQGRYLDARVMLPTIWESTLITANSFIAADALRGASIIERSGLELSMSTDNGTNFEKGLVTFRLEKRLGLAKYYTEAFVKGTFTGVGGAITTLKS
jgi:HK97 family phage major capsid protein